MNGQKLLAPSTQYFLQFLSPSLLSKHNTWTLLAVQWLGLHASTAGDTGLIPGPGTKIPT